MRSTLLSVAALPLVARALEFLDDNKFVEQAGLVRFPLTGNKQALDKHLRRQQQAGLDNRQTGFFYTIDLEIGTPSQTVAVNFDTGSSELWVNPNCAKAADPTYCKTFGAFGKSSSWVSLNQNTTLNYGRGYADIDYGYDYVTVGTSKINQQIFGVAQDSEFATTGIMGVGPNLAGWNSPYPYVLDNLYTQKFINSRAFSLDLRHVSSTRGAAVFGGIDTKKFKGPLVKKPIIPASSSPDGRTRYWATCDAISISQPDGTTLDVQTQPQVFLFDSGYTISALPTASFNQLLKAFPSAKVDPSSGQYSVDCTVAATKGSVDFKFGDATISVSYDDFLWQQPTYNTCILGAIPDDKFPVLGDTFLRAAYVVYDWDNRALHFAASDDCGSNLVAIGSGPGAVPTAEGDCGKIVPPANSTSTSTTSTATSTTTSTTSVTSTSTTVSTTDSSSTTSTTTSTSSIVGSNSTSSTAGTTASTSSTVGLNSTSSAVTSSSSSSSLLGSSSTGFPNVTSTTTQGPTGTGASYTTSITSTGNYNATTYTSIIKSTRTHTITSCAPTVTNCPIGKVTTEVITSYTTWCPGETSNGPKPTSTAATPLPTSTAAPTTTSTSLYTKPPCPEVTLTFVIPKTYYCTKGQSGCTEGQEIVTSHPATMVPITPAATPTPIPGCIDCHPKAPAPTAPAGVISVPVNPHPVQTAAPSSIPAAPRPTLTTLAPPAVKPTGTGAPVASQSQPPLANGAAGMYIPGFAAVAAAAAAVLAAM